MRSSALIAILVAVSFTLSLYSNSLLPETVASHWDAQGQPNGYMPKTWLLFLMPAIAAAAALMMYALPLLDPLKANIDKFRPHYDRFIVLVVLFLLYLHILTLLWNLGYTFNMVAAMVPGLAALFYSSGILIENAKRNWFMGIRTPWTLSSDKVWDKTHKIGAKLFKASAAISLVGLVLQDYAIYLIIAPILLSSFYVVAYSYLEYKKEKRNQ
ncbi:MAG: SdpI family protein [Candidatus Altiarchaeota archaeon]